MQIIPTFTPPPSSLQSALPGAPPPPPASAARLAGALRWLAGQGAPLPSSLIDWRLLADVLGALARIDDWVAAAAPAAGGGWPGYGGGGWAGHPSQAHAEAAVGAASVTAQLRWRLRRRLVTQQRTQAAATNAALPLLLRDFSQPTPAASAGDVSDAEAAGVPADSLAAAVVAAASRLGDGSKGPTSPVTLAAALESLGAPVLVHDLSSAAAAAGCVLPLAQQGSGSWGAEPSGGSIDVHRFASVLAGLSVAAVPGSTAGSFGSGSAAEPPLTPAERVLRDALRACPRFVGHLDMRAVLVDSSQPGGGDAVPVGSLVDRLQWACGVRVGEEATALIAQACHAPLLPPGQQHAPPTGGGGVSVAAFLRRYLWLWPGEAADLLGSMRARALRHAGGLPAVTAAFEAVAPRHPGAAAVSSVISSRHFALAARTARLEVTPTDSLLLAHRFAAHHATLVDAAAGGGTGFPVDYRSFLDALAAAAPGQRGQASPGRYLTGGAGTGGDPSKATFLGPFYGADVADAALADPATRAFLQSLAGPGASVQVR